MFDPKAEVQRTYDEIGEAFSVTRRFMWPEILPIVKRLRKKDKILDLGCGNGRLLSVLNPAVDYLGIDFSKTLLKEAVKNYPGFTFRYGDITDKTTWEKLVKYDAIFCLAVFHHLTVAQQKSVLNQISSHLASDGVALISVWRLWQKKFLKYHLKSWRIKLFNWHYLYVPFQHNSQRFCNAQTVTELTIIFQNQGLKIVEQFNTAGNLYFLIKK